MNSRIARVMVAGVAATMSLAPLTAPAVASVPALWRLQATLARSGQDVLLYSVAADGTGDAWTIGDAVTGTASEPVVFHWHGQRWQHVRLPAAVLRVFGTGQAPAVIGAASATTMWAFDDLGHWMRLDGTRWTAGRLPLTSGGQAPAIQATVVLGRADAWAFGSGGAPYAAHFNGRRWRTTPLPGGTGITSASAVTGSDLWAVNEQDVLRWNGRRWRVVMAGTRISPRLVLLASVYARSAQSVWVGGGAENSAGGKSEAAAHWNGRSWRFSQVPATPMVAPFEMTSVVPDGRGGLWGLGTSTSLGGWRLWRFTAGRWRAVPSPVSPPAGFSTLSSDLAWQPGSASAWAAGWRGSSPLQKGMILLAGPAPVAARPAGMRGGTTCRPGQVAQCAAK